MDNLKKIIELMKPAKRPYFIAIVSIILSSAFTLVVPIVIKFTLDSIIGEEAYGGFELLGRLLDGDLIKVCILILILTILRGIFLFTKSYFSTFAAEYIAKQLKDDVVKQLQNVKFEFYNKYETGDLIQRATSDIETIRRFMAVQLIEIANVICMLLIITVLMIKMDKRLTLVALSLIPVIATVSIVFFKKIKEKFIIVEETESAMTSIIQENLNGIRVVKAFGNESRELEKFSEINLDFRKKVSRLILNFSYFWSSTDLLCFFQLGLILVFGIKWSIAGNLSIGTVVAFVSYETLLFFPIRQFGRVLNELSKSLVAIGRISEIMDAPLEFEKQKGFKPSLMGDVEFKNISFSYDDGLKVLRDISFYVRQGETVGILGATGSGKSTISYLLTRLYEVSEGEIIIGGNNIKDIDKKWLRKNIGLILQDSLLYARSVKENIAIKEPRLSDGEIIQASKIASLHNTIGDLEDGYDTIVGEKGVSLSGGQRQRVAIARTIVRSLPIMFFDDSLSALDNETEFRIRQALSGLSKNSTTFIVSHRMSTLSKVDRVLVIENGRVSEFDNHKELVKKEGLYKRIWDIQNISSNTEGGRKKTD
jgi:ATP-binding cassette subfamily B protein